MPCRVSDKSRMLTFKTTEEDGEDKKKQEVTVSLAAAARQVSTNSIVRPV